MNVLRLWRSDIFCGSKLRNHLCHSIYVMNFCTASSNQYLCQDDIAFKKTVLSMYMNFALASV
jgi:hypothetical protein